MAERPNLREHGSPLGEVTVLCFFQQVLAATVAGELVEDPSPIQDIGRMDLTVVPALRHVGQILANLHHLAAEVRALIDTHPEPVRGLKFKEGTMFAEGHQTTSIKS